MEENGSCCAESFLSELSSWSLRPFVWHKKWRSHMPSTLLSGQLSNPQDLYASWVEQAAYVFERDSRYFNPARQRWVQWPRWPPACLLEHGSSIFRSGPVSVLSRAPRQSFRSCPVSFASGTEVSHPNYKRWRSSAQVRSDHLWRSRDTGRIRCSLQTPCRRARTEVHIEKANMYENMPVCI